MWRFAKSAMVGSAVGAVLPMCLSVSVAIQGLIHLQDSGLGILGLGIVALFPLIVSFPIVLCSSLLVGIPTYLILRKLNAEGGELYMLFGGLFGVAIPIGILLVGKAQSGFWLAVFGMFAGVATANTWWVGRA
jgi:hypothetical protein